MKKSITPETGSTGIQNAGAMTGPSGQADKGPIRITLGVYLVSLLVVIVVIFVSMLVMYLPGYQTSQRLKSAINNADYVYIGIRIDKNELKSRDVNPLTKEDDIVKILKDDMGAKRANAEVNPDLSKIKGE